MLPVIKKPALTTKPAIVPRTTIHGTFKGNLARLKTAIAPPPPPPPAKKETPVVFELGAHSLKDIMSTRAKKCHDKVLASQCNKRRGIEFLLDDIEKGTKAVENEMTPYANINILKESNIDTKDVIIVKNELLMMAYKRLTEGIKNHVCVEDKSKDALASIRSLLDTTKADLYITECKLKEAIRTNDEYFLKNKELNDKLNAIAIAGIKPPVDLLGERMKKPIITPVVKRPPLPPKPASTIPSKSQKIKESEDLSMALYRHELRELSGEDLFGGDLELGDTILLPDSQPLDF